MNKNEDRKKKYYILYETTNMINGMKYAGAHSTNDLDDGYLGSGLKIIRAIKKNGRENFSREILGFYDDIDSMYNAEREYVNEEYVARKDTYNIALGGMGGGTVIRGENTCIVKYADGRSSKGFMVYVNDPRIKTGELVGITKGYKTLIHKTTGKSIYISMNELHTINQDEYRAAASGLVAVRDLDGNTFSTSVNDPRLKTGEIISTTKNYVIVKDKDGIIHRIHKNDNNINTYTSIHRGRLSVKDKDGNILYVSVNDPRYLSGELVSNMVGLVHARLVSDRTKIITVTKDDPRWKTGEIIGNRKGLRRINNGIKEIEVFEDEIDDYINKGWERGKLK